MSEEEEIRIVTTPAQRKALLREGVFTSLPDLPAEEKAVIIAMPRARLRHPVEGSMDHNCERCGAGISLAPDSQRLLVEGRVAECICLDCAPL